MQSSKRGKKGKTSKNAIDTDPAADAMDTTDAPLHTLDKGEALTATTGSGAPDESMSVDDGDRNVVLSLSDGDELPYADDGSSGRMEDLDDLEGHGGGDSTDTSMRSIFSKVSDKSMHSANSDGKFHCIFSLFLRADMRSFQNQWRLLPRAIPPPLPHLLLDETETRVRVIRS